MSCCKHTTQKADDAVESMLLGLTLGLAGGITAGLLLAPKLSEPLKKAMAAVQHSQQAYRYQRAKAREEADESYTQNPC